jgi:cell division protein FtsX
MSDRQTGLVVVLDEAVSDKQAEAIAAAIRLIRGVSSAQFVSADPDFELARERVNAEWRQRIIGLLDDEGV